MSLRRKQFRLLSIAVGATIGTMTLVCSYVVTQISLPLQIAFMAINILLIFYLVWQIANLGVLTGELERIEAEIKENEILEERFRAFLHSIGQEVEDSDEEDA